MKPELLYMAGKWLWDNYGKELASVFLNDSKTKWKRFNWPQAEAKYRSHLRELYGTTKVLNRDIKIQNLYTDVFVEEQISADRYIEPSEFQAHVIGQKSFSIQQLRKPIKQIALQNKRVFIFGKPGAGKTTFLKYLTLQSCMGNINKTPIFITLKDWSDTDLDMTGFIDTQFEVCSFPDPHFFVNELLNKGGAMVLCDGLDEVDVKKRDYVVSQLELFSKKYINTSIFISCRIGAIEKLFERYKYIEIADFDEKQINVFARKWFEGNDKKLAAFLLKLSAPDNQGLRELAQTPLLLALLCIIFEENLEFPKKKIDLYIRAVDVLLEKWDAKRGITRENAYFKLSRRRKENLLGYLATMNFEAGKFVFEKEVITQQVENFFLQLPEDEVMNANGELVLKTIQEHHGLLVERSQNIYSFSHLTFQEFFTAKYIVDNAANGSVSRLVQNYWNNDQWYEIFRMTFGMLDEGTEPVNYFINSLNSMLRKNENLDLLFKWSYEKAKESYWNNIVGRCLYAYLGLIIISSRVPDQATYAARSRDKLENFSYIFSVNEIQKTRSIYRQLSDAALELSQKKRINLPKILSISKYIGTPIFSKDLGLDWKFESNDYMLLQNYLQACKLLIDCMNTTRISNRENIIGKILAT